MTEHTQSNQTLTIKGLSAKDSAAVWDQIVLLEGQRSEFYFDDRDVLTVGETCTANHSSD